MLLAAGALAGEYICAPGSDGYVTIIIKGIVVGACIAGYVDQTHGCIGLRCGLGEGTHATGLGNIPVVG